MNKKQTKKTDGDKVDPDLKKAMDKSIQAHDKNREISKAEWGKL